MKEAATPVKPNRLSGDTASLNQKQWEMLYANVADADTAQAILEMADAMPVLIERHPSLVIQARKTLVFEHNEPARRRVRRSLIGLIGFAMGRFVGGMFRGLRHGSPGRRTAARGAQQPALAELAVLASTRRNTFAVKSGVRLASRG